MHLLNDFSSNSVYKWLLPVPGFFHLEMHMQQCIWRFAGEWLLSPLAVKVGRSTVKFKKDKSGEFRITDRFLELLLEAVLTWIRDIKLGSGAQDITEFMVKVKANKMLYEFMWVMSMLVSPYVYFRLLVRQGKVKEAKNQLMYWFQLFYSTNKVS